jgi:hypothetical protein
MEGFNRRYGKSLDDIREATYEVGNKGIIYLPATETERVAIICVARDI